MAQDLQKQLAFVNQQRQRRQQWRRAEIICQNTTRERNGYQGNRNIITETKRRTPLTVSGCLRVVATLGPKCLTRHSPQPARSGATSEFEIVSFCTSNKGAKQVGDGLDHQRSEGLHLGICYGIDQQADGERQGRSCLHHPGKWRREPRQAGRQALHRSAAPSRRWVRHQHHRPSSSENIGKA
jgi:hypothetical protein